MKSVLKNYILEEGGTIMYLHDVHILIYVAIAIVGATLGKIVDIVNGRLLENKKMFGKDFFRKDVKHKTNSFLPIIHAILYIIILYTLGIKKTMIDNIQLLRYLILTPFLLSVFVIDYKEKIIPNRINLTIFELGIVLLFIAGIFNINVAIDMVKGMLVGGGIFLLITLLGGLIAGKEAMGFGDVKLMTGLGLFFGFYNTIMITLISFLLGAVISVILLLTRIKKTSEYIPFGPFIVMACFVVMLIPSQTLLSLLITIFSLGMMNSKELSF